jgi:deoxyribonuclease V
MQINYDRPWVTNIEEAKKIQLELRPQVITSDCLERVDFVAGVDVGFEDNYSITKAAVAVLSYPDLQLVETAIAKIPTTFPYIPGFLSFREIPAILKALQQTKITPDLILCDGQGLAHPRRFGIACHLGVILDVATIGVAKSLLVGTHAQLPSAKGNWQPLIDRQEVVGAVLRTRTNVKPVYVSVGHRVSLASAIDYVLNCTTKYRLPETTRWADKFASEIVSS